MIKKYKFHIITIVVVIFAVAIVISGGGKDPQKESTQKEIPKSENNNMSDKEYSGDELYGILRASEDKEIGNYKLVLEQEEVFIKTSRNYDALIGSNVFMTIDGSLESFRLIDIFADSQDR